MCPLKSCLLFNCLNLIQGLEPNITKINCFLLCLHRNPKPYEEEEDTEGKALKAYREETLQGKKMIKTRVGSGSQISKYVEVWLVFK